MYAWPCPFAAKHSRLFPVGFSVQKARVWAYTLFCESSQKMLL